MLFDDELEALQQPRLRIAVDGDVIDAVERDAGFIEAIADRGGRESRPMFDAAEALLFRGRDELAVDHDGRGRVGVVRVDAEDQ